MGLLPAAPESNVYHGFISYSHAVDGRLAPALEKGLQRFAKPWYRPRALHIFRDEASLSANPHLWASIQEALDGSRFFIVLASPEAATSPWVGREVERWCQTKPTEHLLLCLTGGELVWAEGARDFDFVRTDALPEQLRGAFTEEPRYIDLRWTRTADDLSLSHPRFRDAVAELAAPLHGKPKDEIASEEVRQHRRTVRISRAAAAALLTLTVLAVVGGILAVIRGNQAVNEKQIATSRQYAAESLLQLRTNPQLALLLARESAKVRETPEALDALRRALPANHQLRALQADGRPIISAALSRDESLIATASENHVIRVWHASSGRVARVLHGHSGPVLGVAFDASGRRLLSWSEDGSARLWDIAGRRAPVIMQDPGGSQVLHASISPNGRLVATSTFLHSPPRVWDASSGRNLFSLGSDTRPVPDIEFSREGRLIATGSVDGTATLWNAGRGRRLRTLRVTRGSKADLSVNHPVWSPVDQALFSPDGHRLLTSSSSTSGGSAQSRIWDVRSLRPVTPTISGGDASFSPDGRFVVTTGGGRARVWNARTGQLVRVLKGANPIAGPAKLSGNDSSGDPRYAVTGSQSGTAVVWDALRGSAVASLAGTAGAVTPVGFLRDGGRVLTYGSDGTARLWRAGPVLPRLAVSPRMQVVARQLGGSANVVDSSFKEDPNPLWPVRAFYDLSAARRKHAEDFAYVVDMRTGVRLARFPFPSGRSVSAIGSNGYVAFDAGARVMLVMGNGAAQIRAVRGGRLLGTLTGVGSLAIDGAMSPDGRLVATAEAAHRRGGRLRLNRVEVWDAESGTHLATLPRPKVASNWYESDVSLRFSPSGKLLLTAYQSGITVVSEARSGRVLNRIRAPSPPAVASGGAISPDDRLVVTTSDSDNDAHVYQVGQPGELVTLQGHSDGIHDAAFNRDGTLIATTSGHSDCTSSFVSSACDNSIRLWDTRQSRALLTFPNVGGTRVEFSPDGQSIVTNDSVNAQISGTVSIGLYKKLACIVCGGFNRLLALARRAEIRQLTPQERVLYLNR
jgi:WD40 repeat protein